MSERRANSFETSVQAKALLSTRLISYPSLEQLQEEINRVHFVERLKAHVVLNKVPKDTGSPSIEIGINYTLLLAGECPNLRNALLSQLNTLYPRKSWKDTPRQPLAVAIGFHGFGCRHLHSNPIQGQNGKMLSRPAQNYWTGFSAGLNMALGLDVPFFTPDLPGYNADPKDHQKFKDYPWLIDIDHYPYVFLQVIEQLVHNLQIELADLIEKERPDLKDLYLPLQVHLIGHSAGARGLLVAASVDQGDRLKKVIERLQKQTPRCQPSVTLTAFSPAFGVHENIWIEFVKMINRKWILDFVDRAPSPLTIALLRVALDAFRNKFNLAPAIGFYDLLGIVTPNELRMLEAHPSSLSMPPKVPLSTMDDLALMGVLANIIHFGDDELVNHLMTGKLLGVQASEMPKHGEWEELLATVDPEKLIVRLTENSHSTSRAASTVLFPSRKSAKSVKGAKRDPNILGHTAELTHPGLLAFLMVALLGLARE